MREAVKTAGRLILAGGLAAWPAVQVHAQAVGAEKPAPSLADGESAADRSVKPVAPVGPKDPSPAASTPAAPPAVQPAPTTPPSAPDQPAPGQPALGQPAPVPEGAAAPAAPGGGPQAVAKQLQQMANAALAERFCELAQAKLRSPVVTDAMWTQAGALLDASHLLDPADPRYVRLQCEVALKVNDVPKALERIKKYRELVPDDVRAQLQRIDLELELMQTADAKLTYLAGNADKQGLFQRTSLLPEVRSHAAWRAVPLLDERGRGPAMQMLDKAIELFPLNASALRLKYAWQVEQNAPLPERTDVLLKWLKANPAQPATITELADRLSELGLSSDAVRWYGTARPLYVQAGQSVPSGFVPSYATQLYLLGQVDTASGLLKLYVSQRPLDADAWFVRLAVDRPRGDQANSTVITDARQALYRRWQVVADRIEGRPPTPAPVVDPTAPGQAAPTIVPPDPAGAIAVLSKPDASDADKQAFATVIGDLAWFELYFGNDLQEAENWMKALSAVGPKDAVAIVRLNGWHDIVKGAKDDARKTLEPLAKTDPIAAMGLMHLDYAEVDQLRKPVDEIPLVTRAAEDEAAQIIKEAEDAKEAEPTKKAALVAAAKAKADQAVKASQEEVARRRKVGEDNAPQLKAVKAAADARATQLLTDNRSGVVAAMIWAEVRSRGVKPPVPSGPEAQAVKAQLAAFPASVMAILEQPQSVYTVRLEPLRFAHGYHEPMYGQISIQNNTGNDLTIGPDGVIHSDLWFDADVVIGAQSQRLGGIAFDRIAGPVVLKPGRGIKGQLVRIDQGALLGMLNSFPGASAQVAGWLVTNPVGSAQGVSAGPAGQRVPFKIARTGFNVWDQRAQQKVAQTLQSGLPPQKIAAMDLVTAYIIALVNAPNPTAESRQIVGTLIEEIGTVRADPYVAGFANYDLALSHPNPAERSQYVNQMVSDSDWTTKLLALDAAPGSGLTKDEQLEMTQTIAGRDLKGLPNAEGETVVQTFAKGAVELLKHPPTTQPATAPAAAPTAARPIPSIVAGQPDSSNGERPTVPPPGTVAPDGADNPATPPKSVSPTPDVSTPLPTNEPAAPR